MLNKKFIMAAMSMTMAMSSVIPVYAAPAVGVTQESNAVVALTKADKAMLKEMFNAEYYATMYPDVAKAVGTDKDALFEHFVNHGLTEGRSLSSEFDVNAYRSCYSDLNAVFGSDVMAYYRHYQAFGKNENRVLTSVAEAQKHGYVVTTFSGTHLAVDAKGKVVSGKAADQIIKTSPAYSNAKDLIREKPIVGVDFLNTIVEESTSSSSSNKKSDGDMVVKKVFNESAYHTALNFWKAQEPKPEDFSSTYQEVLKEWKANEPSRDSFVVNEDYLTAEEAEAKYNEAVKNWKASKPVATDYMTNEELSRYNTEKEEHEKQKPNKETYVVNVYESDEAASNAYNSAVASWESTRPTADSFVVGNYRTKEEAEAAYNTALAEWNKNKPAESDYVYYDNKGWKNQDDAIKAYEAKVAEWKASDSENSYPVKGESETEEDYKAKCDAWEESHKATKPVEADYTYHENKYASQEAANEAYQNAVTQYGEAPKLSDDTYSVGYETQQDATAAFEEAKTNWESENAATKPDKGNYVYHENGYSSSSAADEAYNTDYSNWESKEKSANDYLSEEEKTELDNSVEQWKQEEPKQEDFRENTNGYKDTESADTAYNEAVSEWESKKPAFETELTEEEKELLDKQTEEWKANEPSKEDSKFFN